MTAGHVHQQWQTNVRTGEVRCGLPDCLEVFAKTCPTCHGRPSRGVSAVITYGRSTQDLTGDGCPTCGWMGLVLLPERTPA